MFGVHVYAVAIGAPSWARVVYQALAITLVWAFTRDGYRARRTGVLQADADGLRLDGAMVAPRATIASAFVLASGEPVVRVVLRRRLSIDAVLEDEERARPLVDALGFGIGQSIATFRARRAAQMRAEYFSASRSFCAAEVSGSIRNRCCFGE